MIEYIRSICSEIIQKKHKRLLRAAYSLKIINIIRLPRFDFKVALFQDKLLRYNKYQSFLSKALRDHPFKTSACLKGGGVSPCADGPKVTVHKDQKSPS